jgi:predicted alpha/beta-fold hydrolase
MPLVQSNYQCNHWLKNGHLSTIYAGLLRKVTGVVQQRERIILPDGDFLDLDWSYANASGQQLVLLVHGLEGNAQRAYMLGATKELTHAGFDVCSVNLRGCSGVPNLKYRSYHSGATEDLIAVLKNVLNTSNYENIYLKGFSLGGNLILKYLGEGNTIPHQIKGAVAISVPCQLQSSLEQLLLPKNMLYAARFKKNLVQKLRDKQSLFPDLIPDSDIARIQTLKDFDDIYTSKAHGFKDAMDYYAQCSSLQFLPNVKVPTLIINAKNDSFLGNMCYPLHEAGKNPHLFLEMPNYGGHVGFYGPHNRTYTEKRAVAFFKEYN